MGIGRPSNRKNLPTTWNFKHPKEPRNYALKTRLAKSIRTVKRWFRFRAQQVFFDGWEKIVETITLPNQPIKE